MTTTGPEITSRETTEARDQEAKPNRGVGRLFGKKNDGTTTRPFARRNGSGSSSGAVGSAFGTFVLVWVGTSVVVAANPNVLPRGPIYSGISIGLAFGIALFAGTVVGGPNAQVNPAETLAKFILARKGSGERASLVNLAGQFAGAIAASFAVWGMFGPPGKYAANLGAATPASWITIFTLFLVEMTGTAILVASSFALSISRISRAAVSGATLAALVLATLPITGGSFNPARSLGPAIVAWVFPSIWIYLFAQVIGGIIGGIIGRSVTGKTAVDNTVTERIVTERSTPGA